MKLSNSITLMMILLLSSVFETIESLLIRKELDPLTQKTELGGYMFDIDFKMPPGPIFAKGWLKYTSYDVEESSKPREFFKNFAFYDQFKNSETLNLNSKDNVGFINVPDEEHFFFVLTANTLNVLSSRKNKFAKTIDILNLVDILMQESSCEFKGGIVDHGDFLEGFCFKIKSFNQKNEKHIIWEVCVDTKERKRFWMNVLARLKLDSKTVQKTVSKIIEENNVKKIMEKMKKDVTKTAEIKTKIFVENPKNITWIAIAPWSECSKKCGGGKSYLQRLCILPRNYTGSSKCEGDRILIKDCNMQACKDASIMDINNKHVANTHENSKSPIFKMVPVSNRPLRYEKCVIKDGDLALLITDGNLKGAKIPVRAVLNNRTITIYSSDNYESIIVSHRLSTITGLRKYKDKTCFEIEETKKKTVLCAFVSNGKNLKDLALEWQKDVLLFIRKCSSSFNHELDYKEMTEITGEKVENTLEFYQEKEKDEMEKIIFKTQELALKAVEKELKVEELIEKEEINRQKEQEKGFDKKFLDIQNKDKLIDQALKAKKKQAELYRHQLEIKKKIAKIQEEVIKNIKTKRENLRNKLLAMRRDQKRKERLAKLKMDKLRSEITKKLMEASKKGDLISCDPERPSNEIIQYCQNNYKESYVKMNECVKNDNFCYMCCETEYGELHLEDRSVCYMKCDDFYINKIKFAKKSKGKQKIITLNVDISPNYESVPVIEKVHESCQKINGKNNTINEHKEHFNIVNKKLNEKEILITKFLESKEHLKANSTNLFIKNTTNKINSPTKSILVDDQSNNPIDEQKKQLLLTIKDELSDLNF